MDSISYANFIDGKQGVLHNLFSCLLFLLEMKSFDVSFSTPIPRSYSDFQEIYSHRSACPHSSTIDYVRFEQRRIYFPTLWMANQTEIT
jgi:hypothetical protein